MDPQPFHGVNKKKMSWTIQLLTFDEVNAMIYQPQKYDMYWGQACILFSLKPITTLICEEFNLWMLQLFQDDFLLRHYDKGPCKNKLGHTRASVIWHRTQVGIIS